MMARVTTHTLQAAGRLARALTCAGACLVSLPIGAGLGTKMQSMWERDLVEPSGIAHLTGDAFVVVGDESARSVWIVRPAEQRVERLRWKGEELDDLEAVVRLDERTLLATCSLGRTKNKGKRKPERGRLARIRFDEALVSIASVEVVDGARDAVLEALAAADPRFADIEALRPGSGGLNIEGLARLESRLFLGLREPRGERGIPVVELELTEALFDGDAQLELGPVHVLPARAGEGIRSMCERGDRLVVLLGPSTASDEVAFRVVLWEPGASSVTPVDLPGWDLLVRPEGIELVGEELHVVQDLAADVEGPRVVRFPWPAVPSQSKTRRPLEGHDR